MLGIQIETTYASSDELVAALREIADLVEQGVISDEAGEQWGLVGYEQRPEDGPGMWVLRCVHGSTLYVGQGPPDDDTSVQHRAALRHARACFDGTPPPHCVGKPVVQR